MKFALICLSCLLLLSCRTTDLADWPAELPAQSFFVANYSQDSANQAVQSRQDYLQWVLSFYTGTLVAPIGWIELQSLVIAAAARDRRVELQSQLADLGGQIAAEWAKENNTRVIDSRMLGIWGSVLQIAVEPNQQFQAIQLISEDVLAILAGNLSPADVDDARYEQQLGLQLFGDF